MKKRSYTIDRQGPWTYVACLLMLVSFGLRLGYYWGFWLGGWSWDVVVFQILLPLAAGLLMPALLLANRPLSWTCVPVWMGGRFFIVKALGFVWWHAALCCCLYCLVGILYTLTVLGRLPRLPLILVFALPLAFHIGQDIWTQLQSPMSFFAWLPELSVLAIMGGLLCLSLGMHEQT